METLFQRSIEERLKLEMIYMTHNGEISQRVIRVLKDNNSNILAYCYVKRKVRMFKKNNILSVLPYKIKRQMGA